MGWFADKLLGIRRIMGGGTPAPERGTLNFIGATVTDNDALDRTDVTFVGLSDAAGATANPTPNTIAKRGASGEASFGYVGLGSGGKRIQLDTPLNLGEQQIGDDGRLWVYNNDEGVPAAYLSSLDMFFRERWVQERPDADPLDGLSDFCIAESLPFETLILGNLRIVFGDNVTADDTNYARFRLLTRHDSGGEIVSTIAEFYTKLTGTGAMGNISSGAVKSRTPSVSVIPANHNLWFEVIKNGAGVTLPPYLFSFQRIRSSLVDFG